MKTSKVVDVDGHVMEPSDLWERNLEPQYQDRAFRIRKDPDGKEYMEIEGKRSRVLNGGGLAFFGSLDPSMQGAWEQNTKPGGLDYEEGVPAGARDMEARLGWMDEQGIDIALLYPSLCLGWQNECDDPDLAAAYCRVYNDWLTGLCRPYSDRIVPIAHVSLLRVEDGVTEVRRAAGLGAKGVYLFPVPANRIPYGDRYYDPFWAECQDLGLPVGIHVSNTPRHAGHELYQGGFGQNNWFFNLMYNPDCQIAFTSFFQGAVFERFPRLSVGVVETGCGWIAHWIYLMDAKYKMMEGKSTEMKLLPSEYFDRQGWISGEADEKSFPFMAQLVGAHKLMWGSDYPHEEGHGEPLDEFKETIGCLSQEDQAKILGENALGIYAIG
ncbi:MAG: amidohydrolase family protein [Dehalococcoidia bacterium]